MKIKVRLLAFLLAATLLALTLPMGVVSAESRETSYTKNKVVSVLFDNSGSMKSDTVNGVYNTEVFRWEYAKYALQTLMTTLGKNDTLIITPMNSGRQAVSSTSQGVVVNLAAENREAEINRVMTQTFLANSPQNTTPQSSIQVAVQQLVNRGMKETANISADEKSQSDYVLVVLTDGVFDGCANLSGDQAKIDKAAEYFKADLDKYASFQSIYIGFDTSALDLNLASSLQGKTNFTAYKAPDTASIGGVMQDVANRITGRYPLTLSADKNSTTLRIPLSDVGFSLRTVTLMITDTNARFKSATYNGASVSVAQNAAFDTTVNGMKGGFTTVLSKDGGTFSGGEIVLTLDEAPGANAVISVLLEPALTLQPVIECETPTGRKRVDATYINANLKKGDFVYPSFEIVEQGTGKVIDPSDIGGTTTARVTYNTKTYEVGDPVALATGKKEIGISVSMMNGLYNLYTSFPCVVLENPDYFRVDPTSVRALGNNLYEAVFTVYNNNQPVTTLSGLNAYFPTVSVTDKNGATYTRYTENKNSNGTLTVLIDANGEEYGTFTVNVSVRDADGNSRAKSVAVGHYPTGLKLESTGADTISKTFHSILTNKEAFTFVLTAQDTEIPFENALTTYTLKIGNIDVTSKATVNGNVLTFVPTAETLGALASQAGEYTVKLDVVFRGATTEEKSAEAKFALTPTVFKVEAINPTTTVDRFALKDNQSSVYFLVLRDGIALPAEELQAAIDSGAFEAKLSYNTFLAPVDYEITVESYQGSPAIRVRICEGQFFLLRALVTSMLLFSDIGVSATFDGIAAEGTAPIGPLNIISYIWRILLILYIIQLIILAVRFKSVKRVPKGTLVKLTLEGEGDEKRVTKGEMVKHVRVMDTLLLVRLLPFIGLVFREKVVKTNDNFVQCLRSNGAGVGVETTAYNTGKFVDYDGNKSIVSAVRQKYKENAIDGHVGKFKDNTVTVAVKTEAKKQSGIIPLNEKEGYVTNPTGRKSLLYIFVRPER